MTTASPNPWWEYLGLEDVAQDLRVFFILQRFLEHPASGCNRHETPNCSKCKKRFRDLKEKLRAFADRNANGHAKGIRR